MSVGDTVGVLNGERDLRVVLGEADDSVVGACVGRIKGFPVGRGDACMKVWWTAGASMCVLGADEELPAVGPAEVTSLRWELGTKCALDGAVVGGSISLADGSAVGCVEGSSVGLSVVEDAVGLLVVLVVGRPVGDSVGFVVDGEVVGSSVGVAVVGFDGFCVGTEVVGAAVIFFDGRVVGVVEGFAVGLIGWRRRCGIESSWR